MKNQKALFFLVVILSVAANLYAKDKENTWNRLNKQDKTITIFCAATIVGGMLLYIYKHVIFKDDKNKNIHNQNYKKDNKNTDNGLFNYVSGNKNTVNGNFNYVPGNNNMVNGNFGFVFGNRNTVNSNFKIIYSNGNTYN